MPLSAVRKVLGKLLQSQVMNFQAALTSIDLAKSCMRYTTTISVRHGVGKEAFREPTLQKGPTCLASSLPGDIGA